MKLETILDAMEEAYDDYIVMGHVWRRRQYRAFRARILRMDAELEKSLDLRDEALGDANKSIDKLNKRIAELEAVMVELCVDCYQIYYDMIEAGDETPR